MVVKSVFDKLGYSPLSINLGEVVLAKELSVQEKVDITKELENFGFAIIDDKRSRLIFLPT